MVTGRLYAMRLAHLVSRIKMPWIKKENGHRTVPV
jgi:hypothetical protein